MKTKSRLSALVYATACIAFVTACGAKSGSNTAPTTELLAHNVSHNFKACPSEIVGQYRSTDSTKQKAFITIVREDSNELSLHWFDESMSLRFSINGKKHVPEGVSQGHMLGFCAESAIFVEIAAPERKAIRAKITKIKVGIRVDATYDGAAKGEDYEKLDRYVQSAKK